MAEVKIDLPAGGYRIVIDLFAIDNLGNLIKQLKLSGKAMIVTDENVGPLYGEKVVQVLKQAGIEGELAVVVPGEDSKSLAVAGELYTKAIETGLDRQAVIVALGGGVVGDLAGFVAATYLRGVPFVQVPTTLLAQVDSSIGGKVAVNHPLGKNLIGAFYQPRLVVADINALATIPRRELSTGLAEIIKHGLIADKSFFEYLQANRKEIIARQPGNLLEMVRRSCEIKGRVVEQDEKETYLRMILNFGHTIGHAIEGNTAYSVYTHGEAVAIGMHGAALISYYMGLCTAATLAAVRDTLEQFGLPVKASDCRPEELMSFLARDKKSIDGAVNWVLLESVGKVVISNKVPQDVILKALTDIT